VYHYLAVLNAITGVLQSVHTPVVIQGFFHDPDCLTYWHFDRNKPLKNFAISVGSGVIFALSENPQIYLLHKSDLPVNDQLRDYNLRIRKSTTCQLELSEYFAKAPQVEKIEEFTINLVGLGVSRKSADIELGAPGILKMLETLPFALECHQIPRKAILETTAKAQKILSIEQSPR
jgi:hypothetical protein